MLRPSLHRHVGVCHVIEIYPIGSRVLHDGNVGENKISFFLFLYLENYTTVSKLYDSYIFASFKNRDWFCQHDN